MIDSRTTVDFYSDEAHLAMAREHLHKDKVYIPNDGSPNKMEKIDGHTIITARPDQKILETGEHSRRQLEVSEHFALCLQYEDFSTETLVQTQP